MGHSSFASSNGHHTSVHSLSLNEQQNGSTWSLAVSPPPSEEARHNMVRPRNIVERARLNVA